MAWPGCGGKAGPNTAPALEVVCLGACKAIRHQRKAAVSLSSRRVDRARRRLYGRLRVSLATSIEAALRRPGGEPAVRCLALLHGAACVGRLDVVPVLLAEAARLAITAQRLRETALQVVAYGGFPRSIGLLSLLGPAPEIAPVRLALGTTASLGRPVWDRVYGSQAEAVLAALDGLFPGFSALVLDDAYGHILARPGLTLAERELLAVAALALMALPAPLGSHIRGALRNGSNAEGVIDILETCRVLAHPHALLVLEQAHERLTRSLNSP